MWELSFASLKSLPLNEVKGQALVNNKKDSEKFLFQIIFSCIPSIVMVVYIITG